MMGFGSFTSLLTGAVVATLAVLTADASPTGSTCLKHNLIQNPSFESSRFTPWINFHGSVVGSSSAVKAKDLDKYFVAELVTSDTFISVRQSVGDLAIGQSYAIKFWYGLGTNQKFYDDICSLSVTMNGEVVGEAIDLEPTTVGRFEMAERIFVAEATSGIVRFEFNCGGNIAEVDALLDNISLIAHCA